MICVPPIYSQEPAAESSQTSSSDTSPSSPSNGTPTPAPSCADSSPACASSRAMSAPWTSRASWLASMRSALASLVPTSAPPTPTGRASTGSEADSTAKSCVQSTLFDLPGCSWKTPHTSEPRAGTSSSATWWRVDIPGATESCPRLMLEPRTGETAGGYLPTVTATSHKQGFRSMAGGSSQLWPTPTASLGDHGGLVTPTKAREGGTLTEAVSARFMWQTPVADDSVDRISGKWNGRGEPKLSAQVKLWPTPAATDHKTPYRGGALMRQKVIRSKPLRDAISAPAGGKLNAEWVCWLMGWPLDHTNLPPDKRSARKEAQKKVSLAGQKCSRCGSTEKLNRHHRDYNRPLEVTIICRECHMRDHKEEFEKIGKDAAAKRWAGKPIEATCPCCGAVFRFTRPRQKTCSRSCGNKMAWLRRGGDQNRQSPESLTQKPLGHTETGPVESNASGMVKSRSPRQQRGAFLEAHRD